MTSFPRPPLYRGSNCYTAILVFFPPPIWSIVRLPEVPKIRTRADVDVWQHDLYVEAEQGPRDKWEKERVRERVREWGGGGGGGV